MITGKAMSSTTNVHLTNCPKEHGRGLKYHPPTSVYEERAKRIEKDSHNTNIFNGRNISDNTPASHYYQAKARPAMQDAHI
jgi:hypothetical protein